MTEHIDPATEARAIQLFTESMELPLAERQQWLIEQAGDDEVLTDQLRRLVEAEAQSTGFLEQAPELNVRQDRVGTQVGAYTIIDEHAIGGMSTVYRAERSDGTFEQQVAIKVFDAVHLRGDMAARFAAERRILAALEHPGIARIIDGGALEDHTPYVVMEWIEGEPITRYCNRNQLDLAARLMLFCRVCEALELAHRRGVVHRDIKPGNVLVNDSDEPKLIDFGIAKQLDAELDNTELPETRQGLQLMTPEYASPEQVRGQPVGQASDVYSLGVLLYELLTGTRPHQLAGLSPLEIEQLVCESISIEPSAVIRQSRNAPPEGLGEAAYLQRRLKGDLDRIVMTAMRHEPDRRYESAAAFADDIHRYLSNKPVRARGASKLYRASKFISRHRAGFSATVVAFAALATALVLVQIQATEARKQAERAESASQFLTEMIARADPFELNSEPTLAGAIRLAIPDIGERFTEQPELEGDMRYAFGYALQNLGEIHEAREQLELALELREQLGNVEDLAEAHDAMALIGWWESEYMAASESFQHALSLLEGQTSQRASLIRVNVMNNWSGMLIETGDNKKSAELANQALAEIERFQIEDDPEDTAVVWSNLATALEGLGDFEASLAAFDRSLQLRRQASGELTPDYAITLNNLAFLYQRMGRYDDAIEAQQRSVQIREQTLGPEHPALWIALSNLARMQIDHNQLESAEQNAMRSLTIARSFMDEKNARLGKAYEAVALVLQGQKRFVKALEYALQAKQLYQNAEIVNSRWVEGIEELIAEMEMQRETQNHGDETA